jgi:hypothetical protein
MIAPSSELLKSIIYRKSSEAYGASSSVNVEKQDSEKFPLTNAFTKTVSQGGILKREGLDTSSANKTRVHQKQYDWMLNNS